ncbi:ADP-ribosylation factor-like protein 4C [Mercenaria mercenaria]|uniref:ADP-ribosylation factor-like protein 4C n=1 Tax=Mercenaria mercenaria TaxID=6596 RepID=UPI001E1DA292|nr:ADP-ribosylation factor-like protein 4C [Mercenaria mercenaria]
MGGSSSTQIAMLGLDSAGKTTCLYRLKFNQYTATNPTVGFNCEKINVDNGTAKGSVFTIWDVGGQDKTRPLWKSYTRKADGIIYVVDSTDKERLEEAKIELTKLLRCPETLGLPVVVLANKQDLPRSMDSGEVEKLLSLHELPPGQLWHVEPTCAVTGEGLDEAVEKMCELIIKKKKAKRKR